MYTSVHCNVYIKCCSHQNTNIYICNMYIVHCTMYIVHVIDIKKAFFISMVYRYNLFVKIINI